ncbi:hypothetical protein MKW94_007832 [Papaver nudicaule]|uniref:25S rRNA (uridine-N(3))-methyltransferase BMT5-like domain-containing protein n=1 Tax=Papaver nudicaule TaxID=74823 RepID=A0AA41SED6_PAPNU|nr:hypothetical protein [Papaver nudicaule]
MYSCITKMVVHFNLIFFNLSNHKYSATLNRRLPSSQQHIFDLRRRGCLVLHEIDVHSMASEYSKLKSMKFDRIIYNFPHAGHWRKLREEDFELIREDGEVHVAHRNDYPYNTWGIDKLAKKAGLFLIEIVEFRPENYPLYRNKRGSRIKSWDSFGFGDSPMTFKFSPVKKKQNMAIHS